MDREALMHWILRKFGAPRWNIELHPCQLEDAIEDAIQWFVKWKGKEEWHFTDMIAQQVEYPWPDDADAILDVVPPEQPDNFQNAFNNTPYYSQLIPYDGIRDSYSAGGPISSFVQATQYNETASRVMSRNFEWQLDKSKRVIILSPIPPISGKMAIKYKSACFNLAELSAYDHELLKRYALASAREVLGLIRRKYSRIPGADGDQQLDGDQLVQEAREDMEKLDEEIRKSCYPMAIITG